MKKLLFLLPIFILISCHKEVKQEVSYDRMAQLFANDILEDGIPSAKGGVKGKPKPPIDTTKPPVVIKDTVGQAVVLIDFDGNNNNYYRFSATYTRGILEITTPEQRQTIVDSIAYDYRDYNIVFTTDENVYQNAPTQKRMRVVYTVDYLWYPNEAGGVADLYSFEQKDAVCFVFVGQDRIVPHVTKFLSEAGSHELGHTFGLVHIAQWENGVVTATYCNLKDVGDGHVHLMGIPYYGASDIAPGRMANGQWDYPDLKIKEMLD